MVGTAHVPKVAASMYFIIVGLVAAGCTAFNGGIFSFTIDDPYIHLALAENLVHGHYGINTEEFSASSSSIGFPWLLIPGFWLGFPQAWAFLLNAVPLALTVGILARRLGDLLPSAPGKTLAGTLLLAYSFALIALPLTGMEHGLHVFCTVTAFEGLARTRTRSAPWWLSLSLAGCVALRFEGFALALLGCVALAIWRQWTIAALSAVLIAVVCLSHARYMESLGLPMLPSSVLVKSDWASDLEAGSATIGSFVKFLHNFVSSSSYAAVGQALLIAAVVLLYLALLEFRSGQQAVQHRSSWPLWLVASGSILAHLLAGKMGWFNRYEIYVVVLSGLALMTAMPEIRTPSIHRNVGYALIAIIALCGLRYTWGYARIPWASHNISEQQYVLHRFAADFYDAPVAVNDLGWVSYRNPNYVLDLVGLGSEAARKATRANDTGFLSRLSREHRIGMVMIFREWFEGRIPEQWVHVGDLKLTTMKATTAGATVQFYRTQDANPQRVTSALEKLQKAYPDKFFPAALPLSGR